MEVPGLGVKSELQLPAYTIAAATPDWSHVCDLHHSSGQRWILNPLSEAREQTHVLMDPSQIHFHWATTGTPGPSSNGWKIRVFIEPVWSLKICQLLIHIRSLVQNGSICLSSRPFHVLQGISRPRVPLTTFYPRSKSACCLVTFPWIVACASMLLKLWTSERNKKLQVWSSGPRMEWSTTTHLIGPDSFVALEPFGSLMAMLHFC